jgi:hypothetical protein
MCDMFNCRAACLVDLRGLRTKAARTVSTWASVTGRLPGLCPLWCSQSNRTIYTTCKSTFLLAVSFQIRNRLYTVKVDLDSWNQSTHLAFSTWDAILTTASAVLQVERFGNSSGTNYNLDHIIYSDAFSFHSSAYRFMSIFTVKWYTFHVHALYLVLFFTCFCMYILVLACHRLFAVDIHTNKGIVLNYYTYFIFQMKWNVDCVV